MKNQALFSSKDKSKKIKCRLLQFLFLRFKGSLVFFLLQDLLCLLSEKCCSVFNFSSFDRSPGSSVG